MKWTPQKPSVHLHSVFNLIYLPLTAPSLWFLNVQFYCLFWFKSKFPPPILSHWGIWTHGVLDHRPLGPAKSPDLFCEELYLFSWASVKQCFQHVSSSSWPEWCKASFARVLRCLVCFKALASALCQGGMSLEHGRHVDLDPKPGLFFNYQLGPLDRYG